MNSSWSFDDNFNGIPEDFFDDAMKYLDPPMEDLEPIDGEDWVAKFQHLDPPPYSVLTSLSSGFGSQIGNDSLEIKKCSPISWQSTAAVFSNISSLQCNSLEVKHPHLYQTSSPISVLDSGSSSSSCSGEKSISNCAKFDIPGKRPRSKRSRSRRSAFNFISSCYTSTILNSLPASGSELLSCLDEKVLNPAKKRDKKKKDHMLLPSHVAFKKQSLLDGIVPRKCTHCEVTKTPQWREGPMGPKTLCNACGVRYRSGRLLPEYRPAASPTFSPFLHSNSHRKVLEMRKKSVPVNPAVTFATSSLAARNPRFDRH